MIAALGGVLTAVLVLGTLVSSYFALRANQKADEALSNARLATQQMQRANRAATKAIEEAGRADKEAEERRAEKRLSDHRLYVAEMNLAQQAWLEHQTHLLLQHLESVQVKRPEDPDLRGFEWYYLRRSCDGDLTLSGGTSVAFSPDGSRVGAGSNDGTVRVWDTVSGRAVHTLRGHKGKVERGLFQSRRPHPCLRRP